VNTPSISDISVMSVPRFPWKVNACPSAFKWSALRMSANYFWQV